MGEISEMMMNGLLCQQCGVWMDDFQEVGYPRTCGDCAVELKRWEKSNKPKSKKKRGNKK